MSVPLINYSSPGKSFWSRANAVQPSTINASTITTGLLGVFPNPSSAFTITPDGGSGITERIATTDIGANNTIVMNSGAGPDKILLIGLPASQDGAFIDYNYQSRGIGSIGFLPGSGPPFGAINLVDEQNDFLFLGNGNLQFNTTSGGSFQASNVVSSNLTARAITNVSTINGAVYPPVVYPPLVPVTLAPGFAGSNVGIVSSNGFTNIANIDVVPGAKYRITMNPTFFNQQLPSANDSINIYGTSATGPADTIDFVQLNCLWYGGASNIGIAGACGFGVSGIMTATATPYQINADLSAGATTDVQVTFGDDPITCERIG